MKKKAIWLIVIILALGAPSIFIYKYIARGIVRMRQVTTYANMQTIAEKIKYDLKEKTKEKAYELIRTVANGKDDWGHEFVFYCNDDPKDFHYILLSKGSDNKMDLANIVEYMNAGEVDVHGKAEKDIVFRDGKCITRAGK